MRHGKPDKGSLETGEAPWKVFERPFSGSCNVLVATTTTPSRRLLRLRMGRLQAHCPVHDRWDNDDGMSSPKVVECNPAEQHSIFSRGRTGCGSFELAANASGWCSWLQIVELMLKPTCRLTLQRSLEWFTVGEMASYDTSVLAPCGSRS